MIDRNDSRLTAYVLGELAEEERHEIEREMESSPELQGVVAETRRAAESLEAYFREDALAASDGALGASLVQKVVAESEAIAESDGVSLSKQPRFGDKRLWAIVATGLGLALLVGALIVVQAQKLHRNAATATLSEREIRELEKTLSARVPPSGTKEIGVGPNGAAEADLELQFTEDSFRSDVPRMGGFEFSREGSARGAMGIDASGSMGSSRGTGSSTSYLRSGRESGMSGGQESSTKGWGEFNDFAGREVASEMASGMGMGAGGMGNQHLSSRVQGREDKLESAPTNTFSRLELESGEASGKLIGGQGQPQRPAAAPLISDPKPVAAQASASTSAPLPAAAEPLPKDRLPGEKPSEPKRTWRRAKATPNASRLMIGDEDELPLEGMQANVVIDGFRARVLIDLYFFNDRQRSLEGSFQLRLPDEASPYYFAFGETSYEYRPKVDELAQTGFFPTALVRDSGANPEDIRRLRESSWNSVKEARVVPREKAAYAYGETVRRRIDPALVEWAGAGVFNARVFPLAPQKLHRIVIGYDVNLRPEDDGLAFDLALPQHRGQCSIDVNLAALPGTTAEITPEAKPFTAGGRAYYHYTDPQEETIHVKLAAPGAIVLSSRDEKAGEFFAARFTPELPKSEAQAGSPRAIFLVDTSLSSLPDRFNLWLKLLEATLNGNRDAVREFAVVFFNIDSHWWKPGFTANTPEAVDELLAYCHTLALEGATDVRQALAEAAAPQWLTANKEADPKADLFLFSDGAATWGETNLHLIARAGKTSSAGPLFAYRTGLTGTDTAALEHLARESGGAVFSVLSEDQIPQAVVAHRKRPWRLVAVETAGGGDFLTAGRIRSIYSGQSVLLVGRGKPTGDIALTLRRGEETQVVKTAVSHTLESELAARVYGEAAVGQLEDLQASSLDMATAYARHFRVTGQTCSLLMLDSEADYERFQIKPEDDAFVVKSTPASDYVAQQLDAQATRLEDPKAQLLDWLAKLATYPGARFETSAALRIALEKMPAEAFDVKPQPIACREHARQDAPKKYFEQLVAQELDYATIVQEADRRRELGAADRLKVLSNLIETNPGDTGIARDVAFAAMEMGLPGQAWPLLKRVALMRPYEPQVYQAMADCLTEIGRPDLALVFYEVAIGGQWHERYRDLARIATVDYLRLLRRIDAKQLTAHAAEFAHARRESLKEAAGLEEADLVVSLMWSTDRTDVDLHIVEPSGEECFYQHTQTRSGGELTRDVTEGFGPEMYVARSAQHGKYAILANFYGDDSNRTSARTKVYVTIYENYGRPQEKATRRTVLLASGKEKREVATVMVEK